MAELVRPVQQRRKAFRCGCRWLGHHQRGRRVVGYLYVACSPAHAAHFAELLRGDPDPLVRQVAAPHTRIMLREEH